MLTGVNLVSLKPVPANRATWSAKYTTRASDSVSNHWTPEPSIAMVGVINTTYNTVLDPMSEIPQNKSLRKHSVATGQALFSAEKAHVACTVVGIPYHHDLEDL